MTIDWSALVLVFVVALVATIAIVSLYSFGLRLHSARVAGSEAVRPMPATVGAWLCFAVSAAAVLYGVYLVIPAFHR